MDVYMQLVNIILVLYNYYCKKRTLVDKFHFIRGFGMTQCHFIIYIRITGDSVLYRN